MLVKVQILHRFAVVVRDSVYAAGAKLVHDAPTNVGVVPVNHPHAAFRASVHVEPKEMLVIGNHEVAAMCASKTGSSTLQIIHV